MKKLIDFFLQPSSSFECDGLYGYYSYEKIKSFTINLMQLLVNYGVKKNDRVLAIIDQDELAFGYMAAASGLGVQIIFYYNLNEPTLPELNELISNSCPDHIFYFKKNDFFFEKINDSSIKVKRILADDCISGESDIKDILALSRTPVCNFLILFTSGTTGSPKAISISESLIISKIKSVSKKLSFSNSSNILMSGLLNNTTGVIFSFGALLHGAKLFFPFNRDVSAWPEYLKEKHITHVMFRPASLKKFLTSLKNLEIKLPDLEVVAYGATILEATLLEEAMKYLPCDWIQGYGLSETFGPFCWLDAKDHQSKRYLNSSYCIGKVDDTVEVCICDGELCIKSENIMQGYYDCKNQVVLPKDEWFKTGDYVYFSSDGYLNLLGRRSDSLLSDDGHKIYFSEIECFLKKIPYVKEAALFSERWISNERNDELSAVIFFSLECKEPKAKLINLLVSHVCENLSQEKWPKFLYFSDQPFPLSDNEKIDRKKLLLSVKGLSPLNVRKTHGI